MAIQGIQVPMYTKHTLFLYFCDFSFEKQKNKNKDKTTKQKQTNNMKA